jgi:Tfp pilus assembly protein PilP
MVLMNRFVPIVTSIFTLLSCPHGHGEVPRTRRNLFQPVETTPMPRPLTAIPPLQRYPITALTLTAIITNTQGERFASVENPEGIGYKVERGTVIGNEGARVVEITMRGMVVEEAGAKGIKRREILLRGEE